MPMAVHTNQPERMKEQRTLADLTHPPLTYAESASCGVIEELHQNRGFRISQVSEIHLPAAFGTATDTESTVQQSHTKKDATCRNADIERLPSCSPPKQEIAARCTDSP